MKRLVAARVLFAAAISLAAMVLPVDTEARNTAPDRASAKPHPVWTIHAVNILYSTQIDASKIRIG